MTLQADVIAADNSATAVTAATTTTRISTTTAATTKACVECMRRKIRCNGHLPCDKCIYYEVPICQYRPRKQRKPTAVSPTAVATAASRQTAAEALVARLFPGQDPAALMRLPSQTLLELTKDTLLSEQDSPSGQDGQQKFPASPSSVTPPVEDESAGDHDHNNDDDEGGRGWHEFKPHYNDEEVCDDVNGLSVNVHRRSYLGTSSIQAIFRAMFRVKPSLQWELQRAISLRAGKEVSNPSTVPAAGTAAGTAVVATQDVAIPDAVSTWQQQHQYQHQNILPTLEEETAINAYFAHVHGIVPLLDEVHFRDLWRRGQRCDRPWLALLNMVLVLGALAFGDERSSHAYYLRAQTYLDFELLATGCLESLQALCLLGGLYLHLKNAPNMAYTVMGMVYRIAIGLGLHRLPAGGRGGRGGGNPTGGPWRPQIRQRIWWSLFCLDTWGSMSLGRPTLGRWDPRAMTIPRLVSTGNEGNVDALALSLDCASAFCLVATKIQQRLAQPAPIGTDEILLFDAEVQSWHRSMPPVLLHVDQCPPSLRTAQRVLRYRYFNLRLQLLRSALIRYAHAQAPAQDAQRGNSRVLLASLPPLDQQAVCLCRDIACEAVEQIRLSFVGDEDDSANRLLVWSAVWYLYQATMVLLLSIMVDPDHAESPKWRASVEAALVFLANATPVSRAAQRSRLLVQSLLQICTGGNGGVVLGAGVVAAPITSVTYPAVSPNSGLPSSSVLPTVSNLPLPELSNEDLWSLLGLDMFTEGSSTWGANEFGDWPMTDYSQFGA
ncbi:hypothetical protein SBRCBS47491_003754 [Sporothrix bragantina]|uniref:Zn(2)-C6 fungal-type domain-containing protein n=1 Tax=Sporothrix bragantina TaxID=671064 RepID=A0ABP0BI44_9PEZI